MTKEQPKKARSLRYASRRTRMVVHRTGTAAEVIAAVSLDGRTIGDGTPGPITRDLMTRFGELTRGTSGP